MSIKKKLAGLAVVGFVTLGAAGPAFAFGTCPYEPVKCNSGRGNGSELVGGVDCDPGNSGGRNNGGD